VQFVHGLQFVCFHLERVEKHFPGVHRVVVPSEDGKRREGKGEFQWWVGKVLY
jgi:hypothetical protein